MSDSLQMKSNCALVMVGALAGGGVGFLAARWGATRGLDATVLAGGLIGLGAGAGQSRSVVCPVICGIAALALGMFTEWSNFPFVKDPSFAYFVAHFTDVRPLAIIAILIGAFIGFWVPFRRRIKN